MLVPVHYALGPLALSPVFVYQVDTATGHNIVPLPDNTGAFMGFEAKFGVEVSRKYHRNDSSPCCMVMSGAQLHGVYKTCDE